MAKFFLQDRYWKRVSSRVDDTEQESQRKRNAFIMMVIATAVLALMVGNRWSKVSNEKASGEEERAAPTLPSSASERAAIGYVQAVQRRDFERVFLMTEWMQQRVEHIRLESGRQAAEAEIETFYRQEREDFFSPVAGPELTEEGIADVHLFPQGAVVRVVEVREGLWRPVLSKGQPINMVVMGIEYPLGVGAPTAAGEKRIDRLRAALYLTLDGKIIKASVRGNARVYPDSIVYRHLTPGETRQVRTKGLESAEPSGRFFSPRSSVGGGMVVRDTHGPEGDLRAVG